MAALRSALLALVALTAAPLSAAPLDEAWRLFLAGEHDAAAAAAAGLVGDESERAGALNLLGSIAWEQGRCEVARERWTDAAELGGMPGHEAALKLALLRAAGNECPAAADGTLAAPPPGRVAPAAPVAPPATPAAELPSAPAGPMASPPGAPVPTMPPPATEPAMAEESAGAPAAALTLIAGRGTPFDEVQKAVARVTSFLRQQGVAAESPTQEIAVVQESAVVLGQLLAAARERDAAGVLLLDARFGHRERVTATCYDPQGGTLFAEEVTGGLGLVRPVRMNTTLMERIEEKLAAHVGGPCLPLTE